MADRVSKQKTAASPEAGLRRLARAWAQEEGRALLAERDALNREGPTVLLPRTDARIKEYLRARRHRRRRTWVVVAACLAVYLALPQALIAARDMGSMSAAAPSVAPSSDMKAMQAPSAPAAGQNSELSGGGGASAIQSAPTPSDTTTTGAPAPKYGQAPITSPYAPPMPAPQPWWSKLLDILWPWGKLFNS